MSDVLDLRAISRAVARRWLFVLSVTAVAAVAGNLVTRQVDPVYEATTSVLAGQNVDPADVDDSDASERLTLTLAELVRGRPVMSATVEDLGLDQTIEQLRRRTSVDVVTGTQVLVLTVQADSPELAEDIARVVAEQFIAFSADVTPLRQTVIEPANADDDPVSPDRTFNTILAGAIGFLVASAVALLREFRPWRKGRREPGPLGDAVEFGAVPSGDRPIAFTPAAWPSFDAEAYAEVFARLNLALGLRSGRVMLVVGRSAGGRRSIAAANLATMFALAGARPVLVDADLRRPIQHELFQVPSAPGLRDYLTQPGGTLVDLIRDTSVEGLDLVPAGTVSPNAAILLSPPNLDRLFAALQHLGGIALIDCPLDESTAEAALLAQRADVVVLVGSQRRDAGLGRRTIAELELAGVDVSGILVVEPRKPSTIERLVRLFGARSRRERNAAEGPPEAPADTDGLAAGADDRHLTADAPLAGSGNGEVRRPEAPAETGAHRRSR
jgi:capsular polysaccharide biosynthesis protein/Mrp family chromosome partitioning ATPase